MTELHLYIETKENETIQQALSRTDDIIESLFGKYGFTVLEQGENENADNEIKTLLIVDVKEEYVHDILNNFMYQVY